MSKRGYAIKRFFDVLLCSLALVLLSPLFLVLMLVIRVNLGSPVFFCQERPGLNEKKFLMYKFRTMRDAYDEKGNPLPDADRLTKLGVFLRSTSLDELPELINIIKGDMSIVGPRPLLTRYLPFYTEEERLRHTVRPGLTGLAQVSGRNAITWEDKLRLDVEYVQTQSFLNDLKLIFRTARKVFAREGILVAAPQGPLDRYREGLRQG